jgi:hypothetical protein
MINDPIVDEIHVIREQLAAKYNFDVVALGQSYLARQTAENRPVVARLPKPVVLENYVSTQQLIDDEMLSEKAA